MAYFNGLYFISKFIGSSPNFNDASQKRPFKKNNLTVTKYNLKITNTFNSSNINQNYI
jgi:hypothetical protein